MKEDNWFQEGLTIVQEAVLNNAILFGMFVITVTFLIFLLTPYEAVVGPKLLVSTCFGLLSIVAGLMWKDLG